MKKILLILILLIPAAVFAVRSFQPKPVPVLVKTAELGDIQQTVVNTRAGDVKACRRAKLSPPLGGQIASLPAREGLNVKAGELLLALRNDDLKAEVDLAAREVESAASRSEAACLQAGAADARADAACTQAGVAVRQAKRQQELRKSMAVAEEKLDAVTSASEAARSECEAARAAAEVAKAECRASKTAMAVSQERKKAALAHFDRTLLVAPFDGVVAEVNGEVGEYLTPSPPGIATLPAVDLVDRSCFYVAAPIDEVDAAAIRPGMEARISLDAAAGRSFPGRVRRVADSVLDREKQARTVEVEVEFANPGDLAGLLPGYSADAEVILAVRPGVLRIPSEAVIGGSRVLVFTGDGKPLDERPIRVGLSNWDFTEVTEGLAKGESVVVSIDRKGVEKGAKAVLEAPPPAPANASAPKNGGHAK